MCLAAECNRRQVASTCGHLGQPGAGGVASVVGRQRRYRGRGCGRLADAPLFQTSGRYVLVLLRYLKFRKLKVPKCENFHRTDFFDFFTIKPLWVGDFRAKIKN